MLTRRRLLGGGLVVGVAAVAGAGVTGCSVGAPGRGRGGAQCVARAALEQVGTLGDTALVYEEGGSPQAFAMEPDFAEQLRGWLTWWVRHSGDPAPEQLYTYGTWIDGSGSCGSWHHAGRALDVTGLHRGGRVQFSGRMDRIEQLPAGEQGPARRRYWRLAAGLNLHFADVLTHLYDDAHRNHIHVDNGVSGTGLSHFTGRSEIQTLGVQAICTHVWARDAELTGRWDRATRRVVDAVAEQAGVAGDLTDDEAWHGFLTASVERRD